MLSAAEMAAREASKPAGVAGAPAKRIPSGTEMVLDEAAAMAPGTPIQFHVVIADPGFDFTRFRGADAMTRDRLVAERQAQVLSSQDAVAAKLAAAGATGLVRFWIVNQILATASSSRIPEILTWPGVVGLATERKSGANDDGQSYTGSDARTGMLTASMISDGIRGNLGARSNGATPVHIGSVGSAVDKFSGGMGWIARNHVGWRDGTGFNRVVRVYDCTSGTCVADATTTATVFTHTTLTTWIAAGSIEAGQDSNFPGTGTADQRARSGEAPGAWIYVYIQNGCASYNAVLQRALGGVDSIDVLFRPGSIGNAPPAPPKVCDPSDCGSINLSLAAATDAGVLNVACGGNDRLSGPSCNLWYPGVRSEVLAVNGLQTDPTMTPPSQYQSTALNEGASSRGPIPITRFDGWSLASMAGVALSAPGTYVGDSLATPVMEPYFTTEPNSYGATLRPGCSYATPAVAGAAALLRHAFYNIGWQPFGSDARILKVNMLNQSDGFTHPSGYATSGMSYFSGAGRMRMHYPSSANLTAPWDWGTRYFSIHNGETVRWPVGDGTPRSGSITQWKWALTWDEPDFNAVADIDIRILDTCPPGGGEVEVARQNDYDLRNRIKLSQTSIAGKCLRVQIHHHGTLIVGTFWGHCWRESMFSRAERRARSRA